MNVACPKCGGKTINYGRVKRVVRTKSRETRIIFVQRVKCQVCGRVSRVLPDSIVPYKQYEKEVITGVQEGLIDSGILGFEDYPCEMTMRRWKKDTQN